MAGNIAAAEDLSERTAAQGAYRRVPDGVVGQIVAQVVGVARVVGPGAGQIPGERGRYLLDGVDRVNLQLARVAGAVADIEHQRPGHANRVTERQFAEEVRPAGRAADQWRHHHVDRLAVEGDRAADGALRPAGE